MQEQWYSHLLDYIAPQSRTPKRTFSDVKTTKSYAEKEKIMYELSGYRTPNKMRTGFSQFRRARDSSLFQNVQAGSVAHSTFFLKGTKVLSRG